MMTNGSVVFWDIVQHSCKKNIKLIIVYHQDNLYLQLAVLKLDSKNESGFFFRTILVGSELYLINNKAFADKINIRCRKNSGNPDDYSYFCSHTSNGIVCVMC